MGKARMHKPWYSHLWPGGWGIAAGLGARAGPAHKWDVARKERLSQVQSRALSQAHFVPCHSHTADQAPPLRSATACIQSQHPSIRHQPHMIEGAGPRSSARSGLCGTPRSARASWSRRSLTIRGRSCSCRQLLPAMRTSCAWYAPMAWDMARLHAGPFMSTVAVRSRGE